MGTQHKFSDGLAGWDERMDWEGGGSRGEYSCICNGFAFVCNETIQHCKAIVNFAETFF